MGWPHRTHGAGSGAAEVSHFLDSPAAAAPHGRPQFTFGHSLNKTLKRAGISTDFKEWTELAQDRAGWQKLIYQTAKFPPEIQRGGS